MTSTYKGVRYPGGKLQWPICSVMVTDADGTVSPLNPRIDLKNYCPHHEKNFVYPAVFEYQWGVKSERAVLVDDDKTDTLCPLYVRASDMGEYNAKSNQLALALLADIFHDPVFAQREQRRFCEVYIPTLPELEWTLTGEDIWQSYLLMANMTAIAKIGGWS